MEFQFEAKGRRFTALDTGRKKNGYTVYEIQDAGDAYVDTVMVHPLDNIEDAVAAWSKNHQGKIPAGAPIGTP